MCHTLVSMTVLKKKKNESINYFSHFKILIGLDYGWITESQNVIIFIAGPTDSSLLGGPLTTERERLALLEMVFHRNRT